MRYAEGKCVQCVLPAVQVETTLSTESKGGRGAPVQPMKLIGLILG